MISLRQVYNDKRFLWNAEDSKPIGKLWQIKAVFVLKNSLLLLSFRAEMFLFFFLLIFFPFQSQMLLHLLLFFPHGFYFTKPGRRSWPKGNVLSKFLFTCSIVLSAFYMTGSFLFPCLTLIPLTWDFLVPLIFYTPAVIEMGLCL